MIFNFENINNEVIKTILKGKHSHKIIVTGLYALHNIYEKENRRGIFNLKIINI